MRMMMVTMIHFLDLVYTALKYQNPFHNLMFFFFITQCVHLHREKASMYTCGASYIACIAFLTGTWRLQLTSSVYPQFTFSLPTLYRKFSLILSSHPHPPHSLPSPFPTPLPTPLAPRPASSSHVGRAHADRRRRAFPLPPSHANLSTTSWRETTSPALLLISARHKQREYVHYPTPRFQGPLNSPPPSERSRRPQEELEDPRDAPGGDTRGRKQRGGAAPFHHALLLLFLGRKFGGERTEEKMLGDEVRIRGAGEELPPAKESGSLSYLFIYPLSSACKSRARGYTPSPSLFYTASAAVP